MKKTPKQYAVAFYQAAQGKKAKELDRVVLGFVKILQRDNKLGWKEKILAELTKYSQLKEGIKELEITSARELSGTSVKEIKKKFGEEKKVLTKEKVSPEILGGIILKLDDKLWNFSLKKQLQTLKNQLKTN
jgi:F0F1-type ATP synthase delta subunit